MFSLASGVFFCSLSSCHDQYFQSVSLQRCILYYLSLRLHFIFFFVFLFILSPSHILSLPVYLIHPVNIFKCITHPQMYTYTYTHTHTCIYQIHIYTKPAVLPYTLYLFLILPISIASDWDRFPSHGYFWMKLYQVIFNCLIFLFLSDLTRIATVPLTSHEPHRSCVEYEN